MKKIHNIKEAGIHFWDYYKIHVISIIGFIIMILLLDFPALLTKPETKWNGTLINSPIKQEEADGWMKDFKENYLKDFNENHEYRFDTSISFSTSEEVYTDYDQMGKFTALIAGHEIDFVISDKETIQHYAELGGFIDLKKMLDEEDIENWKAEFIYFKNNEKEMSAFGVDLTEFFLINKTKASDSPVIGAIPINSERKEMTVEFLMYLAAMEYKEGRTTRK
ncbi:hypothetical protein LZ578_00310 [Jeotgalibaca sp. MA1X17-3]|uniref:hypothetical protein n=1 Tax=Jeotgalibaca sp. MA1X17-3 TaxID=2908211 RepID=UPI001F43D77F|nr:hypothetical protein [Jeotgalibaca sp. MA1X17-3]UJF15691.1 hypothetical protein LZ578_00310 [Jeotgalibaca sp. MA1X17-3]